MYRTQCALSLLALCVGVAHSFDWDVVLSRENRLDFFDSTGTITHTEDIASAVAISTIIYDGLHNRVIFGDNYATKTSISSFDIATKEIRPIVKRKSNGFLSSLAYDPLTEELFWIDAKSIYSFSVANGSKSEVDGHVLITLDEWPRSVAVDSCRKFIYWTTNSKIERARSDGSEREVLIKSTVYLRHGIAIDQQTEKIYWIEEDNLITGLQLSIESADLNGQNRKSIYIEKNKTTFSTLTVSKSFVYWRDQEQKTIWRLPKNSPNDRYVAPKRFPIPPIERCWYCQGIAAHYNIEQRDLGIEGCLFCVHGMMVNKGGNSACECTPGYTGERCEVSVCHNYCFHGSCSVDSKGKPECRCNINYYGHRCISNKCKGHCFNDGVCSLDSNGKRYCKCKSGYEGERCEYSTFYTECFKIFSPMNELVYTGKDVILDEGVDTSPIPKCIR